MSGPGAVRYLTAGAVAALVLTGAQLPSALVQASPGLWEVSGLPGSASPLRQCIGNMSILAQFEHRGRACSQSIVADNPPFAVVEYSCGAAGFGHSKVEMITPRSLRIETQGVSGSL